MVDLASVTVLFSEWQLLCENPAHELPPIDVSFRDYVLAQLLEHATVVAPAVVLDEVRVVDA
ncbi:hypothetical protein [Amycolatopsis sp. DG1A-15b]|uniref:hypothetical protein n=1 Tax=Amycolatopsis sp. DG1A-15b TaxID=3052846 RepID=UPI00255B9B1C|nr:hypothetical protein [Amycolatopsis sp. DG1A-15b]WIX92171.1 hypothetical protein QRY02_17670 [Amycolatopsis sp. DG1A-15b]